jgi:hypothetical protein
MNALSIFLFASAVIVLTRRVLDLVRGKVRFDVYRQPKAHLPRLGSLALEVVAWLSFAWAVNVAFVPVQSSEREAMQFRILIWSAAGLLVSCALLPRERRSVARDIVLASVFALVAFDLARGLADPPRDDALELDSPFDRDAYVLHGGASPLLNHHAPIPQQAWAIDVLPLTAEGLFASADKGQLTAYACFGAPLASPCNGTVAHVVSDRPDMAIGKTDLEVLTGNSISIETVDGRYVVLAHLQAGSIQVQEGQRVVTGQTIARCGNSGNTSLPHLHLQVQNRPVLSNEDRTLRTFPMHFTHAERVRAGSVSEAPFAVRRNDVIRPLRDATRP